MGTGYLRIQVETGNHALPIFHAHVIISNSEGTTLYDIETNANGDTGTYPIEAPDRSYTLDPNFLQPAYSVCNVDVMAAGFITLHIRGVEIVDTQTSILPVHMMPLVDVPQPTTEMDIDIPPVGLLLESEYHKEDPPASRMQVIIPDFITVHLGLPSDTSAANVRVSFIDYIKNVASSEIYSTWPYSSLVANIHAIVTFALNRVYTEWYRSRGNYFDITNSTSYDQYYRHGGPVFENISKIVDNIFNIYAHRFGFANPFFTQFCNGTTSTCPGLSQWGTVTLANRGFTPIEILRYYYPSDLQLRASDNIVGITESYPGYPLSIGSQGEPVLRMQYFLNRIGVNYPLIPRISSPNGYFDTETEDAVKVFQRTFDLTADGIIGRATWNRITVIYVGVVRLAELDSLGERYTIGQNPPNVVLSVGSVDGDVMELQFILNSISPFYPTVPTVFIDGAFGPQVRNAVIQFQRTFGLTQDGIVGPGTWSMLYAVYRGIEENVPIPAV